MTFYEGFFGAVESGDIALVKRMLADDSSLANSQTEYGATPLHIAAEQGHIEIMKLLISHQANAHVRDDEGETPLFWSFYSANYQKVVMLLLENHADINATDNHGQTILHDLAFYGDIGHEEAGFLTELGAKINQKSNSGLTPLHLAASQGVATCVRHLIEYGADINARDNAGCIPLHYAVYANIMRHKLQYYLKTAEQLIQMGADISAKNNDGDTPLDLARRYTAYPELANLLRSYIDE